MKVFGTRLDFGQDCFTGDIGYEVVFAGCKKALDGNPCKNCHSPHLWSFDENKKELTIDKVRRDLQTFPCDAFIILGGEPLDQNPFVLFELLIVGKQWTKYSILWSGYEEDYVKDLFFFFNSLEKCL